MTTNGTNVSFGQFGIIREFRYWEILQPTFSR
jgi:hypothetical protein